LDEWRLVDAELDAAKVISVDLVDGTDLGRAGGRQARP
jgi:hypothetical protein